MYRTILISYRKDKEKLQRCMRKYLGIMNVFIILIVLMVSWPIHTAKFSKRHPLKYSSLYAIIFHKAVIVKSYVYLFIFN